MVVQPLVVKRQTGKQWLYVGVGKRNQGKKGFTAARPVFMLSFRFHFVIFYNVPIKT